MMSGEEGLTGGEGEGDDGVETSEGNGVVGPSDDVLADMFRLFVAEHHQSREHFDSLLSCCEERHLDLARSQTTAFFLPSPAVFPPPHPPARTRTRTAGGGGGSDGGSGGDGGGGGGGRATTSDCDGAWATRLSADVTKMILSYFAGDPIAAFGVVKASSLTCKDWRFLVHWDHVPALWFPREVQQRLLGIGGYAIPRPQSCSSTRAPTFDTRCVYSVY